MKILLIAGARPNFMKIAPIVGELRAKSDGQGTNNLSWKLVHTGQHYDLEMSETFFHDLELPVPDIYLGVGSGTHAEQTARVMIEFEKVCLEESHKILIGKGKKGRIPHLWDGNAAERIVDILLGHRS